MSKFLTSVVCGVLIMSVAGCATKEDTGTLVGGVAGGLLGNQFGHGGGRIAATAVGALAGAYIGNAVGRSMDETDKLKMSQALENNRVQQSTSWKNPDSGASYTVTPTKTYYGNNNQPCREYTSTAVIAGKRQQVYGHACREADGSWRIID